MIYHPTELMLDDRQREKLQGYDPGFPYTAIDCRFDGYSGPCVDWHWHATLEVVEDDFVGAEDHARHVLSLFYFYSSCFLLFSAFYCGILLLYHRVVRKSRLWRDLACCL